MSDFAVFRALTKNPRGACHLGVPRGLREEPSMVNHGLDLAKVRSSARSQEHLTNSRAKKKNKSRQQHRTSLRSLHRCSKNLNTKVAWERLSFTMCTACLFSESLQNKPEPVFEPRSNLASTFPAQERRRYALYTSSATVIFSLGWISCITPSPAAPCPAQESRVRQRLSALRTDNED